MKTLPKELFRGDHYGNSTIPEKYRSNGLQTKLINSGDPAYIEKNGLLKALEEHIAPEDKSVFYDSSSFLSFSSEKNIAEYFCSRGKIAELCECENYSETHYIFTIHLDKCQLIKRDDLKGIYSFSYSCNMNLREHDAPVLYNLLKDIECEYCQVSIDKKHTFVLIYAPQFLTTYKEFCRDDNSLENATEDKEWLVLPTDYLPSLNGYSSTIPRSDIWDASLYYLISQGKRQA